MLALAVQTVTCMTATMRDRHFVTCLHVLRACYATAAMVVSHCSQLCQKPGAPVVLQRLLPPVLQRASPMSEFLQLDAGVGKPPLLRPVHHLRHTCCRHLHRRSGLRPSSTMARQVVMLRMVLLVPGRCHRAGITDLRHPRDSCTHLDEMMQSWPPAWVRMASRTDPRWTQDVIPWVLEAQGTHPRHPLAAEVSQPLEALAMVEILEKASVTNVTGSIQLRGALILKETERSTKMHG